MNSITDELRPLNEQALGARVEIVTFDRALFKHLDLPATLGATVGMT